MTITELLPGLKSRRVVAAVILCAVVFAVWLAVAQGDPVACQHLRYVVGDDYRGDNPEHLKLAAACTPANL